MIGALAALALAASPALEYPGAELVRIGEVGIAGQVLRLGYFTSADALEVVARSYARRWRTAGFPVVAEGDFASEGVVSAFATREGVQVSVVLRAAGRRTLAFVAIWGLEEVADPPQAALDLGAPAVSIRASPAELGRAAQTTSVVERSPSAVRESISAAASAQGFAESWSEGKRDGASLLVHVRGGEEVVTAIAPLGQGEVAVWQTWAGRPEEGAREASGGGWE